MRMIVIGSEARRGGKEVGEGKEVGSKRSEEGSRRQWGRGGNSGNGCFNNGWEDVLDWDIFVVDDFTRELKLCPIVLIEWREEAIEFGLGEVDDVGSCVFTKLFKVELSHSAKGFEGGLRSRWGWGSDDIGIGVDGVGLKGVWVNEGDVRIGR